jgi:hypothetical protein
MSSNKIQTEFINNKTGQTYFKQYFQTETLNKISIEEYQETRETLIHFMDLLSDGEKVVLSIKQKDK